MLSTLKKVNLRKYGTICLPCAFMRAVTLIPISGHVMWSTPASPVVFVLLLLQGYGAFLNRDDGRWTESIFQALLA